MTSIRAYGTVRAALHRKAHRLSTEPKALHRAEPSPSAAAPAPPTTPKAGPADLLIRNARLEDRPDEAVSVAVKDGVITFVGDALQAEEHLGEHTEQLDAEGHGVLPGLGDAHVHLLIGAERLRGCNVEDVRRTEDLEERVGSFARENPDKAVVHVFGLHYTDPPLIPTATARHLLDRIEADRPLFVYAHDLHTAWANSRALEMADLLEPVPPYPPLLEVLDMKENLVLGEDGRPSGELREPPVYFLVESVLHHRFPLTVEEKLDYLEQTCRSMAELGITRVHNMGLGSPEEDLETLLLLLELEQTGRLPVRVFTSFSVLPDEHMLTDLELAASAARILGEGRRRGQTYGRVHEQLLEELEALAGKRDDSLAEMTRKKAGLADHADREVLADYSKHVRSVIHRTHVAPHERRRRKRVAEGRADTLPATGKVSVAGVKVFMDGVVEQHTAYRLDTEPAEGIPAFTQDEIDRVVVEADRRGLQVAAHCIGDGAVRSMLDAVAAARAESRAATPDRAHVVRHRIEHIELCAPEDLPRFQALEVVPSMQPFHERPPWTLWHHTVPKARWSRAFPWRSLHDTGRPLVFGSDWPIVSCDCLQAAQHAVDRRPWAEGLEDQSLTASEALGAFCANTAFAEHVEDRLGRIAEGMLADLVILSGRLSEASPGALRPVVTVCVGEITHPR